MTPPYSNPLVGALFVFFQRFGLDRSLASPDLSSFSKSQYMTLDAVTLRDLEVSTTVVLRRKDAVVSVAAYRLVLSGVAAFSSLVPPEEMAGRRTIDWLVEHRQPST
ncbi:unnamed protein product [Ectocarpus sp. CCAP 1310/34]|nr:unnamed protein product [Ectocarpus sp. CCAP 1310/34]